MKKESAVFDTEKEIQLQHMKDLGNYNSMWGADTNVKNLIIDN